MDWIVVERSRLRETALGMTRLAHLFAVVVIILLVVWLFHFREGLNYYSNDPLRVFNVHPFLMVVGFIIIGGEGLMAYKTTARAERNVRKFVHMMLNLTALCLGIVGVRAVFKFHDMQHLPNMYSLHSWIGLTTICTFGLQWAFGLFAFLVGGLSEVTKQRMLPWHVCFGRTIMYMAMCSALTGLIEKSTFLQLQHLSESRIINFTALTLLIFGILVDLSVVLPLLAHLLGLSITVLLHVGIFLFRDGLAFESFNKQKIFNLHSLFTVIGFILMGGEAIMVYKKMAVKREVRKVTHWVLHLIALISGIVGIYTVFKFHDEFHYPHVDTLHSWMGLISISLFGLQWILGFFLFVFPGASASLRASVLPWHALLGAIIFLTAVCTAEMGITEKFIYTGLKQGQEALIPNFIGLLIFLFAVSVGLAVLPKSL